MISYSSRQTPGGVHMTPVLPPKGFAVRFGRHKEQREHFTTPHYGCRNHHRVLMLSLQLLLSSCRRKGRRLRTLKPSPPSESTAASMFHEETIASSPPEYRKHPSGLNVRAETACTRPGCTYAYMRTKFPSVTTSITTVVKRHRIVGANQPVAGRETRRTTRVGAGTPSAKKSKTQSDAYASAAVT